MDPVESDPSWVVDVYRDPLTKRFLSSSVYVLCLRKALLYIVELYCLVSYEQMSPNVMYKD